MDGNPSGPFVGGLQGILRLGPEIPELIVVGVSYPVAGYRQTRHLRVVDYTPSSYPLADSVLSDDLGVDVRSGGGPDFLQVLKDELLPFIDDNYRTTPDRALAGHSLGALFVAYALFEDPSYFGRYLISSPSLWWNEGEMFAREARSRTATTSWPSPCSRWSAGSRTSAWSHPYVVS